ncbi:hypothetical protein E2C01_071133 [Portunus trituberculatus]|uniref:Uncharacterized protein n=1 Tax=Portunus trituberculatus TaxID=210409 RepID=A0A5B7I769_PORTR|nr:hypothetical protein [Portunus trituberculatus]
MFPFVSHNSSGQQLSFFTQNYMHLPHIHPSLEIQNKKNGNSKPSLGVNFWGGDQKYPQIRLLSR